MADPGFPVCGVGANPVGSVRAPTSDVGIFQWKRMQKQSNWVPFNSRGGVVSANDEYYFCHFTPEQIDSDIEIRYL